MLVVRRELVDGEEHVYAPTVVWTGDLGTGTSSYRAYSRAHEIRHDQKVTIPATSDTAFRGDPSRWTPEDLLVASLSECHMLTFLHLAADAGVCVRGYTDTAIGVMREESDGGGHFESVILRPAVTVAAEADPSFLYGLHQRAHELCFIASSMNFPVRHEPTFTIVSPEAAPEDVPDVDR